MIERPDLRALLERHRAFWTRQPADRPLLRTRPYRWLEPSASLPLISGRRTPAEWPAEPADLNLDALVAEWERPADLLSGDFLEQVEPFGLCWLEGRAGARVRIAAGTVWAEPPQPGGLRVEDVRARLKANASWRESLRAYYQKLVAAAAGRAAVASTLLRGPLDVAAALVGSSELALLLHDKPARVGELLDVAAEGFVETAGFVGDIVPPLEGGWVAFGIWAPGSVVRLQCDYSAMLSPADYRRWDVPRQRRLSREFDYSIFHLHSGCLHVLDGLLDMPELDAVEVSLDPWPSGPHPGDTIPALARIQAAGKAVVVHGGPVAPEDYELMRASLSPVGLALDVGIGEELR
jgi:hypothetical protein